eukprot:TRINITY_DN3741_c0_g1_i1.p1 TRINITY_DN3741_c0_g1~~TRINITY_DN3741_c0_g1_i1.p1  ORF type:complete len:134 (+),score=9.31 TRINITY_DN3741_c0_g1_i1:64-465(+)
MCIRDRYQRRVHGGRNFNIMEIQQRPLILGYWNLRGKAEHLKLLAEYVGLPLVLRTIDNLEPGWEATLKGLPDTPYLGLPYLQDGTRIISDVDAIAHYLCYKGHREDLLGREPRFTKKLGVLPLMKVSHRMNL